MRRGLSDELAQSQGAVCFICFGLLFVDDFELGCLELYCSLVSWVVFILAFPLDLQLKGF